jgi:hypothetical protein
MTNVQGLIRREGYKDFLLPLLPDQEEPVEITLVPEILDRESLMKDKREDFYVVFAAFVLSLPLPIYLFDATNTFELGYKNEARQDSADINIDEALRLVELRQLSLTAYIGSFFLSAALLVDAISELLAYIDLTDLSTY